MTTTNLFKDRPKFIKSNRFDTESIIYKNIHYFLNDIERYGQKVSAIDTYNEVDNYPERVCSYYYNGLYHIFIKRNGEPVKYRTTKKFN